MQGPTSPKALRQLGRYPRSYVITNTMSWMFPYPATGSAGRGSWSSPDGATKSARQPTSTVPGSNELWPGTCHQTVKRSVRRQGWVQLGSSMFCITYIPWLDDIPVDGVTGQLLHGPTKRQNSPATQPVHGCSATLIRYQPCPPCQTGPSRTTNTVPVPRESRMFPAMLPASRRFSGPLTTSIRSPA